MSLLRPSIAGRILRAGAPSVGAVRRAVPGGVRFESTAPHGTPLAPSNNTQLSETKPTIGGLESTNVEVGVKHNQPDYTAEVDQASS